MWLVLQPTLQFVGLQSGEVKVSMVSGQCDPETSGWDRVHSL